MSSSTSGLHGKPLIVNGQDGVVVRKFPQTAESSYVFNLDPLKIYLVYATLAGPTAIRMEASLDPRAYDDSVGMPGQFKDGPSYTKSTFLEAVGGTSLLKLTVSKAAGTDDQTAVGKIGARAEIRAVPIDFDSWQPHGSGTPLIGKPFVEE